MGQVQYLLDSGHDPTERDARGRPPYLLATHKAVRDAFRRCAAVNLQETWRCVSTAQTSLLQHWMQRAALQPLRTLAAVRCCAPVDRCRRGADKRRCRWAYLGLQTSAKVCYLAVQ